jgi:predicted RND superfamily exporter protein
MGERLIAALLRFAYRRRLVVFTGAAAVALLSVPLILRIRFDSNVLDLLPHRGPAVGAFQQYLARFGSLDRLYILFEVGEDHTIDEAADLVDAYVEELRKAPEVTHVDADTIAVGKDWSYVLDRELLLLDTAERRKALERFAPSQMDRTLAAARDTLSTGSADVKAMVQNDPLGLLAMLRDRLSGEAALLALDPTQRGYVSRDGRARLVIVKPSSPPYDTAFSRQLLRRLDAVAARARTRAQTAWEQAGTEKVDVKIDSAGAYRIAPETEAVITREGIFNAVGSLAGILLLVFIVFRSARVLLCGSLPVVLAAAATLGLAGLFFRMSTAASGASAMLFGLSIDGGLLLYVRYLQERETADGETASGRLAGSGMSMMLGYFTTAATFFGLTLVDFPTLQELGRLIGAGILMCGLFTLALTPALLPRHLTRRTNRPLTTPWLARLVTRGRSAILVVAAIATVGLGIAATRLRLVATLERLEPQTVETEREKQVAKRFGLPEDVVLAVTRNADLESSLVAQRRMAAKLREAGVPFSTPVSLLPPQADQQQAAGEIAAASLSPQSVATSLTEAADRSGFRPDTFKPFLDRLPTVLDVSKRLTADGYSAHGLDDALSRYVSIAGTDVMTVAYVYPRSADEVARVDQAAAAVGAPLVMTGVTEVNRELEDSFLPQFVAGAVIGTAGVILLTFLGFRDVRLTALSLLPTVLGLVWGMGILALLGIELDLFSVFALLMCIGIGVDYGIHVLHRYALEDQSSMSDALTTIGPAILLALATTAIGFATLGGSSYGPLRSMGYASAITATTCLIAALIVLPALLPERWPRRPGQA